MTDDAASSSGFVDQVRRGAERCQLVGRRVAVAVSGGADSTALLRALHALSGPLRLDLVVLHVHHGLRGVEADQDEAWVRALAERLGWPVQCRRVELERSATGRSPEQAARHARYAALEEMATSSGCSHLAVAHTADDQVETVLHHVIRGTGVAGLRGIPLRRRLASGVWLVRPMLHLWRADVRAYLQQIGQDFREDQTNRDVHYTRNRIRHQLLPLLESQFNPNVRRALLRLAEQAADVEEAFDVLCRPLVDAVLADVSDQLVRLDCRPLQEQPRHLVRECLRRVWNRLNWPEQGMGFEQWDALAELCFSEGSVTLPRGIHASRRGHLLVLRAPVD